MAFIYPFVAQLCFIVYIYMGYIIFKKCLPSKEARLVVALCMNAAFWALCDVFIYISFLPFEIFDLSFYEFWKIAQYLSVYSFTQIMFHLVLCKARPELLKKYSLINYLIYLPGLVFIAADVFFVKFNGIPDYNISNYIKILNYAIHGILISLTFICWRRKTSLKREKKQSSIIITYGAVSLVFAIVFNLIRITGFIGITVTNVPEFSEVFVFVSILGIWLAILKYNFISIAELIGSEEIIEKVNDMIYITDSNRKIVKVNASLLLNLGYNKNELIGQHYNKLFGEGAESLDAILENNEDSSYDCYMATASGESIPVIAKPRIIRDSTGDTAGILGICKDMRIVRELQLEVSQRMKKEMQLNYLGMHDALTGLHNRTYFEQEIQRLEQSSRKTIGIIICDVDGLKIINDTLGHAKGDELLRKTTRLLETTGYEKMVAARIGGDEFALIMPDCSLEQLQNEEKRIKDVVDNYNSINKGIPLSISTGSAFTSDRKKSIYTLYKEADNIMYREKLSHKGSVRNITIQALSNMMKARDFNTQEHIDRMSKLSTAFGLKAGLNVEQLNTLNLLVQFHDIGKVGVSDNILFKASALTAEEMEEMKKHSEIGYKIAFATPDLTPIAELILKHHERWDGTGYVLGLEGRQIPLECRLMAIIDSFDAMTNDRPYRKAMNVDFALKEIAQNAGTQFDPELAYLFIEMVTKDRVLL